jgi:hypothetical protein
MKTFKQFISEAKSRKPDYLDTMSRNMERQRGVKVQASENPHGIRVHGIHVDSEQQGKGHGSWAIKNLKNLRKRLVLSQSAKPGREGDLRRFYRKHEFKRVSPDSDTYQWTPQQ